MADKKFVITIARRYGSGGKTVGKMLAEALQVPYYDRELLRMASEDSGINEQLFGRADERVRARLFKSSNVYADELIPPDSSDFVSDDNLFNYQAKVIKELAAQQSCIIVGRCADYILRERDDLVRVFVHASPSVCVENLARLHALSPKEAEKRIEKIDRERREYYRYHTGHDWESAVNYDLCLDSSHLGFDKCVDIIKGYIDVRFR
jgi:cytidylate kinase